MHRFVVLFLVSLSSGWTATPSVVWQKITGDTGQNEALHGMALQYPSMLFVVGEDVFATRDLVFMKYDLDGKLLAEHAYNAGKDEKGMDIDIGEKNNLYITGSILDTTWLILKFDSSGKKLWNKEMYDHFGSQVLFSESGVYFAGWYSLVANPDCRIYKYDKDGIQLWGDYWQPAGDQTPTGIALNLHESIFFVGCRSPYMWGSWKSDGTPRVGIIPRYEIGGAQGEGIALNFLDQVFVCGDNSLNSRSFMLLKYDTSGALLWSDAKDYDLGADEYCRDIKLDAISDCYLTGWQASAKDENVTLIKTDSAGNLLWAWVDTVPGKQEIEAIEVDEEGYVYLAGSHHNGEDWDMLVMKLRQPLFITGKVTDSTGEAMENVPVTISGDTTLDVITDTGGYYGIEFYNGGTYTVSPNLPGWGFTPSSRTYSPLASRMLGQDFTDGRWTGAGEARPPAAFSLDLLEDYVLYSVPSRLHVVVGIYDASGRLLKSVVDGVHEPGAFKAEWKEGIPNGVYFVRLSAGDHTETKKAVLLTR